MIYSNLSARLKVVVQGESTLLSGGANTAIVDLTASPYAHGVGKIMFVMQSMALTGTATLEVTATEAADGTGTRYGIQTVTIPSTVTEAVHEMFSELISDMEDRHGKKFKSLVYRLSGSASNTVETVLVVEPLQAEDGLTPSDSNITVVDVTV